MSLAGRVAGALRYARENGVGEVCLEDGTFHRLNEPWRGAWNEDAGTLPARPVTDNAIARGASSRYAG
jgi:hypothetical protein